jgi:hypothetical protein
VIKEINKYLVDMILINSFRSGTIVHIMKAREPGKKILRRL